MRKRKRKRKRKGKTMNDTKHSCTAENAPMFLDWIKNRGGIAVWRSVNLANPGASWSTPAYTDGKPTVKPTWESGDEPEAIYISTDDIEVFTSKEVKRFHVAVRMRGCGFTLKCTDGATRRIRREVAKIGEGAYYQFDYDTQDAVIMKPSGTITLTEWEKQNKA
jgi:hypothetical protein